MEKKKRHNSLETVKKLVNDGNWEITQTAAANAWFDFGFLKADIHDVLLNLNTHDFYKSMTSYDDASIWQDVYRPVIKGIMAYVKVNILDDQTIVIQFKRK